MTEYKTQEALEYYGDKISYIKFEKDYGYEEDNDIAIYLNLYDVNDRLLNSSEVCRVKNEDTADKRIARIAEEYKELGYKIRF